MLTRSVALHGAIPKVKSEDAVRMAAYVVNGSAILASAPVDAGGKFRVSLSRSAAQAESAYALELVVGPAGMEKELDHVPGMPRVRLERAQIAKAEREVAVANKGLAINEELLPIWWRWCYPYCVSGTLVAPDGCPVPGAQVTVYTVGFSGGGYTKVPRATVTTDQYGNFTACFFWCRCLICRCLWPCWPLWWHCWPWWWEWDILHVIEALEKNPNPLPGPGPVEGLANVAILNRPDGSDLIRGQGFQTLRRATEEFAPDEARTALIARKLSNPAIRMIFPWWWWCCENPNLVFSATQGVNVVLNENPATQTRWCEPDNSTVTLLANSLAIPHCSGDPLPDNGFAWTRVGNITVDKIHEGYADGFMGSDTADLAFAGNLDIYGGFAPTSNVKYYQVEAGQWSGDAARGGIAPGSSTPLSATLNNYLFVFDASANLVFHGPITMGPFSHGGLTNLYATEDSRAGAPTGTGLNPLPATPPGGFSLWAYEGLKVSTGSGNLIGGGSFGSVDLTMNGFDSAFNPVALVPDAALTLTVDNTGITTAKINSLTAWQSPGVPAPFTSGGECAAYDVGPTGFVTIDVTVSDGNGHLWEYEVDAEWGHGHSATVTPPGNRGYASGGPWPGLPYKAPNLGQKSFGGGEEAMNYTPTTSCCYEFRIRAGKRVTDGYNYPSLGDYDFWTISLSIS